MPRIDDPTQREIITQKAMALVDPSNGKGAGWGNEGEISRLKVDPVYSAEAYAKRINFGKVRASTADGSSPMSICPRPRRLSRFKARQ